jgi:hypothetical protein
VEVGVPLASLTYRPGGRTGSGPLLGATGRAGAGANVSLGLFGNSGAPDPPVRNRIAVDTVLALGL